MNLSNEVTHNLIRIGVAAGLILFVFFVFSASLDLKDSTVSALVVQAMNTIKDVLLVLLGATSLVKRPE